MFENRPNVPHEVMGVCQGLKNGGFEAYLVGGCVRDLVVSREPKDWDVTTNANPEQIQGLFTETFYENDFGSGGGYSIAGVSSQGDRGNPIPY